ncbi:hypothetical protein Clacol_003228 [Clathrus columnatus]|uniref:Uncharacterized protein n=1 Tax=Clathrus columnatus TaxID=1419009 RepID=A0AAV5A5S6_9AGAM|nr:hypothetical protein Clacol_003228 [Clathrus columnatus]
MSNLKVMRGAQQLKLSSRDKKLLEQKSIEVRVNYCERSLSAVIGVDPQHTVREVREMAKMVLVEKMKDSYGLELTIDDEATDIHPKPRSESQQWRELPKDTTFVFWPAGAISKDVPLQIKLSLQNKEMSDKDPAQPTSPSVGSFSSPNEDTTASINSLVAEIRSLQISNKNLSDTVTRQQLELEALRKELGK